MTSVSEVSVTARPRRRAGVVVGWLFLVLLGAWLAADVLRTVVFSLGSFGPAALFTDGVLHFRLGAALLILPLAWMLLTRPKSSPRWIYTIRWVGAALCLLTVITLRGRLAWWILAPVLVVVCAPWSALQPDPGRMRHIARWVQLIALLLLYLLAVAGALLISGYAVVPYPAPYPPVGLFAAQNRDARWRQDVRYLASELPRLHLNAYHTVSPLAFQARLNQLESDIPRLSDEQIAVEMMGIVASVGDAHTSLRTDSTRLTGYPLELAWYSDGLYVFKADPRYAEALGARVDGFGRLSTDEAYQAVLPYISYENEAWARQQSADILRIAAILRRIGAVDEAQPAASDAHSAAPEAQSALFHLTGQDDRTFTLRINSVKAGGEAAYPSAVQKQPFFLHRTEPFWLEYRKKTRTLYFRYAACVDPTGFRKVTTDLWRTVDQKPVERLIVDLRANSGGNSLQFDQFFLPSLTQHPEINQPDRLYVLIDSGTFSSAMDNAVTMRKQTRAALVGQPTGGKPNSYGEVRYFVLPNSRFSVFYTIKYFQTMPGDPPSLQPDMLIPLPAADAFAGRDPVLEKVAPGEDW